MALSKKARERLALKATEEVAQHKPLPGLEQPYDHRKSAQDTYLQDNKRELPSSVPMAPPVGYVKQPSIFESVRAMVRSDKLRAEAEAAGAETFEEADDFDVGDDYDPRSPYEMQFDQEPGYEPGMTPQDLGRIMGDALYERFNQERDPTPLVDEKPVPQGSPAAGPPPSEQPSSGGGTSPPPRSAAEQAPNPPRGRFFKPST